MSCLSLLDFLWPLNIDDFVFSFFDSFYIALASSHFSVFFHLDTNQVNTYFQTYLPVDFHISHSRTMKPLRPRLMTLLMSSSAVRSFHSSSVRPLTNVNTKFVLIETKHPGNVGAAARALKNM